MTGRILLVGSDGESLLSLADYLNRCDGIYTKITHSASEAIESVRVHYFSGVVMDQALPDMMAPDLCQALRHSGLTAPIFYSVPRDAESEIILALESGATAVVANPIRPRELVARLRYRSRSTLHMPLVPLTLGELTFDPWRRLLLANKRPISLTHIETQILLCLGQAQDHIMTRDGITRAVWGSATRETAGRLKCHIYRLRKKAGKSIRILRTPKGYRLDV